MGAGWEAVEAEAEAEVAVDVDIVAAEVRLSEDANVISKAYKAILENVNGYRDMMGLVTDQMAACVD